MVYYSLVGVRDPRKIGRVCRIPAARSLLWIAGAREAYETKEGVLEREGGSGCSRQGPRIAPQRGETWDIAIFLQTTYTVVD